MRTTIQDVRIPRYFQKLQSIAAKATEYAKIQIKLASTPTGEKRVQNGGREAGRYETGAFYDSFTWKVTKASKGEYEVRIGWLDNPPDYAAYQEFGFKHRSGMYVAGADALIAAERYMVNEIKKLKV